jgi:hypothetical protein
MAPSFWMASDEWRDFWDPVPATVVGRIPAPPELGTGDFLVVERGDRGERLVVADNPPRPGTPTTARVFRAPEGWDGTSPLDGDQLRFAAEPFLYASREEAPVVSGEQREKARKGWAF